MIYIFTYGTLLASIMHNDYFQILSLEKKRNTASNTAFYDMYVL